jgi:hypothetical protein
MTHVSNHSHHFQHLPPLFFKPMIISNQDLGFVFKQQQQKQSGLDSVEE